MDKAAVVAALRRAVEIGQEFPLNQHAKQDVVLLRTLAERIERGTEIDVPANGKRLLLDWSPDKGSEER